MNESTEKRSEPLPWEGQAYSIKRHGVSVTNCDSEPVQTPGCVQSHGALIVADCANLKILQVSTNSWEILGIAPLELLNSDLSCLVAEEHLAVIRQSIAQGKSERNPHFAFHHVAHSSPLKYEVSLHTLDGLAMLEFEPAACEQDGELDSYELVRSAISQLNSASDLSDFCATLTVELRRLTGLDRVMVYRFHTDGHGEVIAEDCSEGLPSWLGLHYPAEDIPLPAREVFKRIWIRPVLDIDDELVEMLPLANPLHGGPLEMTHCSLRGPSVMYTEYLRNMGVRASVTLPLRIGLNLWGLIACHHNSPYPPFSSDKRTACELLAQFASILLVQCEQRQHVLYQLQLESIHNSLVAQAAQEGGLTAMVDGPVTLADGLSVGGAAIYHRERWWCTGDTPDERQLDALGKWLESRPELKSQIRPMFMTDRLAELYPPAGEFLDVAAGLMVMGLSSNHQNLLLWFRPETIHTINWAGNPDDKPTIVGPHGPRLTPRRSFELYQEAVRGRSVPWSSLEVEAAARLRMMIMDLVVSRAERLAELNADLARSNEDLDAFAYVASHDLKEPLRGIHKYTHQMLEDARLVDEEQRRRLEGLMRLTQRMDTLLDSLLHFSRIGRAPLQYENVDLNELVEEAVEIIAPRLQVDQREIVLPRQLPRHQIDRAQCRRIFVNLLSNALKYNDQAEKRIEIGYFGSEETDGRPDGPEGTEKQVIFYVKDNGIGIAERHHLQIFNMFKRLHGRNEYGGGAGAGLTIVKKLVQRHGGIIWLASAPGFGTTFYFTLPDSNGK